MPENAIIVLGAGMVGSAIALDLAKQHPVTLADLSPQRLDKIKEKALRQNISLRSFLPLDINDESALNKALTGHGMAVCAVPGFLGYRTLKNIISAGKNVVDISFFPEDPFPLDELARSKNVSAVVDCGVAPGLDNILLGRVNEEFTVTAFECLVGGLPKARKWPFNYKAPFSPIDVIEEYTRPARYVENGQVVTREALSDVELVDFDKAGTLESFNSDGLRTLLHTMPHIRNMKEKTLRYPGHVAMIQALKASGFFSTEKLTAGGKEITPLEATCGILFKEWKLGEHEEELTVMRVTASGHDAEGAVRKTVFDLYDEYDPVTETSSMARTTGYTATAAVNLLLNGMIGKKGIIAPEEIGAGRLCFDFLMSYLADRNISLKRH